MKRLSFLLIISFFTIQLYASELVLIATKNLDETKAIFRNPVLTVNFYCSEFAIATLDGHLETPFIGLDDSPWKSNFSYYLVLLDTVNRAKYLSMVGHQVKILYASGNYLFLKTDETVFGRLKPAQNDGLVRVFNTRAKLPEPTNLLKDLSIAPDPFVLGLINRVDTSKITATVQHLQNYGHRGWSHPNGLLAQNWIKQVFTSYDYKVELMDFYDWNTNWNDNVIATKIGKKYPDEYVVIGAHYDSFAWEDDNVAPGADDNASGVAGILETARILSQYDFDRTIIFCAFSGEEYGLYGSRAYADSCNRKGMRILGYFNMDMIGYLKPGNPVCTDVLFTNTALPLFEFYQKVCSVYLPDFIVRKGNMYWGLSDYYPFNNYGYMAIFPFEDYHNYSPYIHTSKDIIGRSYNNAYQAGIFTKASIASLVTLANVVSASIPITWKGWDSSDWNTPGNWLPAIVPKETDNVTIMPYSNNNPVVNEDATKPAVCNNLTLFAGALLTINPGKALTVNGNLNGFGDTNDLMIKSDVNSTGSLKVMGSVSASASVQRLLNVQQRHLISSPIGNQTIKDFIAKNADIPVLEATTAYGMREYAANGAVGWNPYFTSEYLIKDSTKTWEFGKGYYIRTAPDPNPKLLNFEGKLNDLASERIRL